MPVPPATPLFPFHDIAAGAGKPQERLCRLLAAARQHLSLTDSLLCLITGDGCRHTLSPSGECPSSFTIPSDIRRYPLTAPGMQSAILQLKPIDAATDALVQQELVPALNQVLQSVDAVPPFDLVLFSLGLQRIQRLNELSHYALSALTSPGGGNFDAALLFFVNERTGVLQGVLGVTVASSGAVIPDSAEESSWSEPKISLAAQQLQRREPFCQSAQQLRLHIAPELPAGRAFLEKKTLVVDAPLPGDAIGDLLAATLGHSGYLCLPLTAPETSPGVLVLAARDPVALAARRTDGERCARLMATAIENVRRLRRLELANESLREVEARAEQDEKLAMLGELVALIAHDIKTPLVAIGGFARRLYRLAPDETYRQQAGTIASEVRRLEELLGGILSFSRKQLLCFDDCDLPGLMRDLLRRDELELQQAGLEVELEEKAGLPAVVGDTLRLTQLFSNLIVNARQAMPRGGRLSIRLAPALLRGEPAVSCTLADSGPGIPAEILESIFKPFFTTRATGTGLGLAICARIVEQHRGEIRARNQRQGGAVFRVLLPAAKQS